MSEGEFILYTADDGAAQVSLRAEGGTVWLSLDRIATLFGRDKSVVSRHLKAIFAEGELDRESVVARHATTAADGKTYQVDHYRLEVILAVGYRVRSERAVQFRIWATSVLKEYLVKGFAMDDAKLKDPAHDYFDELLERIRDIRTSEARFYQKVRDILMLSEDYAPGAEGAAAFFATIQNKMLYAVTSMTAGELVRDRADPALPNMGLTTWKNAGAGRPLRKADAGTAKNYLAEVEIRDLNLIVETFLNTAELRARRRVTMQLADWERVLDGFLDANDLPRLRGKGGVSAAEAKRIAHERYADFDVRRREARAADAPDELEELTRIAAETGKGQGGAG